MLHVKINGVDLEYIVWGSGEPVILIHGGIIADANFPLLFNPILSEKYQMIHYHRGGYGKSSRSAHDCQVNICQQANDCLELMNYLQIKCGHVVGHSIGGSIALQMAIDYPDSIHSLSLLEPALTGYKAPSGDSEAIEVFIPMIDMYDGGNKSEALDMFMKMTIGPQYKTLIRDLISVEAFEMALKDAYTFFHYEIPAMKLWTFTSDDTGRIIQHVLYVQGSDSGHIAQKREQLVLSLLPQTEIIILKKAKHMLQ
ncbi:MAG: alpha/beta hydrolase, partial [Candidatus Nitrosopolaris sp.]